ncbi:N-acetylmuramoyl-L-alanine amidase, partial [Ruminococcus sp.]|uniref:N-acetylmuramoyl-L-alanine amidase n=1 Tax=Ruminococcus sp. TaxID=41978 RepID=UPI002E81791C
MGYSKLCSRIIESPNHSGRRTKKLAIITPHIIVGMATMSSLGNMFSNKSRGASSNYGVCVDGIVGIVDENNRSWCSSSEWNDQQAITIEVASTTTDPFVVTNDCFNMLVDLCVDICRRNGFKRMINSSSLADLKNKLNTKSDDTVVLSKHNFYANKSCPGRYLGSRFDELAQLVTSRLSNIKEDNTNKGGNIVYKVQVGSFSSKANADAMVQRLKRAGFDAIIKTETVAVSQAPKPSVTPKKSIQ